MIIGAVDFAGDYSSIFGLSYITMPDAWYYFQSVSAVLIVLLAIAGILNLIKGRAVFKGGKWARLFLLFYVLSVAFGVVVGLMRGNPWAYVLGDSRNVIIYLSLFAITDVNNSDFEKKLYGLFAVVCIVVLVKLCLGFITFAVAASTLALGTRLLLKFSSYLMCMTLLSLTMMVQRSNWRYFLMFFLCSIGTFLSQTRGLFMGLGAGFLTVFVIFIFKRRGIRLVFPLAIICALALLTAVVVWSDATVAFGKWKGEQIEAGMTVRLEQAEILMKLFKNSPLAGVGLGGYDPDYERFSEELRRPYLQELEYHNLLAKLGIVGAALLVCAFGFLFYGCWRGIRRTSSPEKLGLIAGLMAGLVALLVASATNPVFSSLYFHLYVVMLLLALSAVRASTMKTYPL
jgi:O-antigen ligase